MPAFEAVLETEQTLAAAARALDERDERVPRWEILPAPGTVTRVRIALPEVETAETLKVFDGGVGGTASNVAVTDCAWLIETVQVAAEPEQAPPQEPKVEPEPAAAVSVTLVPLSYSAEHVDPQSTPAGDEVTVPVPAPAFVTERAYLVGAGATEVSAATPIAPLGTEMKLALGEPLPSIFVLPMKMLQLR